jgi:hypothetical protein
VVSLLMGFGWSRPSAADDVKSPQVEYSPIQAATGGVNTYVPGKWGLLNLTVTNPLDEPRELLSTTYFAGHATVQYGRRIWIPARSVLHTWQPVFAPDIPPDGKDQFEIQSLVFEHDRDQEVATRDDSGRLLHSAVLPVQSEPFITGMLSSLTDVRRDGEMDVAYELVVAARLSQRMSTRISGLWDRNVVPDEFSLQPLHQLVVADDRAMDDPVGLLAIRRWVHGGGRLWVMLNRVGPQFLERLLGDEFQCIEVDRVGLTTVRIDPTGRKAGAGSPESEHERPVELVRVLVTGAETAYAVNGWPAAIWKQYGAGTVLVTTLAPEGWMRLPTAQDHQIPYRRFAPGPSMGEIAKEFLTRPQPQSSVAQLLEPQAVDYIGYAIPSLSLVAMLLGGFVTTVCGLGAWLYRRGAVEHLGWLAPGLAVSVALALVGVGAGNRHMIPPTAASVELVEGLPGTDDVRSRGTVALYNPESVPGAIEATRSSRLVPDMTGQEGTTKRMVWRDIDHWDWEHLSFEPGQRLAAFAESETLSQPAEARATFGPHGLIGRITGPGLQSAQDALVATREGRMRIDLQTGGEFRAPFEAVLAGDQYVASDLLSDEQNRRGRTYAQIVPELFRGNDLGRSLVMFWADSRDAGFRFDESRRLIGASLVAVPLYLERPAAGTSIRIPPPFLPFRSVIRPDGNPSSQLWNHIRMEWLERTDRSEAWLRFQIPAELLPLELTRAQVILQVVGPMGRLEISGYRTRQGGVRGTGVAGREVVSLKTWQEPVGTLPALELTERELLGLDAEGGFVLGLTAGTDQPQQTPAPDGAALKAAVWRIESLSLELSAVVSP